tara:strand:- start:4038 stop:4994 length:957 start_codon:yes stop_codon:yes gene_type:complete
MIKIPSISDSLNEKEIIQVIHKRFNKLGPVFFKFVSEWLIGAYSNFKDIDMYMILIYLVNNDFKFYRKNGLIIDYDTFYKDKDLEIEEIKIIKIANDLLMPKETVRRKVAFLEKKGIISKKGRKFFIDRTAYATVQPKTTLKNISNLISVASKILKEDNKLENLYSPEDIIKVIKKNFSFCWYQVYKFIFSYYFRWKKEIPDFEVICIGLLIMNNAATNRDFIVQNINLKKWQEKISTADKVGLNAMSISDITGIPRPTVVRKLKNLIDRGYVGINHKKLVFMSFENKLFKKAKIKQKKNIEEMSALIFRILNQISIT